MKFYRSEMLTTTPFDDALDRLHEFHLEYGPGFADHGPMVVEALDQSGRADAIEPWLGRYIARLDVLSSRTDPALELAASIEVELGGDWRTAVARHVAVLATAHAAAAGHGVLRTAHAARGLQRADTPARRAELARGLAYWTASAAPLPVLAPTGVRAPIDALAVLVSLDSPPGTGMISTRLATAATPERLAAVADVDLPDDPCAALDEVITTAAVALRSCGERGMFAVLHGLTSSVAVRDLLPVLPAAAATVLVRAAWTSVGLLWAAYGENRPLVEAAVSDVPSADALVDRAVRNGDEHAIKVAVAVWSEERAAGVARPDLRAAAERGIRFFGG